MKISAIVAVDLGGTIGKENQLLWKLKSDLKMFRQLTTGHHVLMGRNTFESIGKALPNRKNLVVSKSTFKNQENLFFFTSIDDALSFAKQNGENELFVIGGEKIYDQTRNLWDKVYLTRVLTSLQGDVRFEDLEEENWKLISKSSFSKSQHDEFDFELQEWERSGTDESF